MLLSGLPWYLGFGFAAIGNLGNERRNPNGTNSASIYFAHKHQKDGKTPKTKTSRLATKQRSKRGSNKYRPTLINS